MPTLRFTLLPDSIGRFHDAILCLAKFSEVIGLEAQRDTLILTALNSSKSAYASFSFQKDGFFKVYRFFQPVNDSRESDRESRFTCQLYNKALLSVFRGRVVDAREKNTSIERCEVSIQDSPEKVECRLVIKMVCKHGVIKTYKLTYESIEIMHALFDKGFAKNSWKISAYVLKTFSEYFGTKTEHLDMYYESGRMMFTSYTEKIMDGKEMLKQPLQTSIAIDTRDFNEFAVEEKHRIGISVKDFKAVVIHAETLGASITAMYSHPSRPMQLAYGESGIRCEFTLMTIGEYRGGSVTPAPSVSREKPVRPPTREQSWQPLERNETPRTANPMLPPSQPASRSFTREAAGQGSARPSPPPTKPSVENESLFLPADDEERVWAEPNYEEEDQLGWDPSADNELSLPAIADDRGITSRARPASGIGCDEHDRRVAPTQRISEIKGIFD